MSALEKLLPEVEAIARQSGDEILLPGFRARDHQAQLKKDGSVVTKTDFESETFLVEQLGKLTPNIPIVGEEKFGLQGGGHIHPCCWYIDPLDGTSNFNKNSPDFCLNIGLVMDNKPVLGVVYAPALGMLYKGGPSLGAQCNGSVIKAAPFNPDAVRILEHQVDESPALKIAMKEALKPAHVFAGHNALRHCKVAEGSFDLFWLFRTESKWDVAAGHAILQGAGGDFIHADGRAFGYDGESVKIRDYIAHGDGFREAFLEPFLRQQASAAALRGPQMS